MEEELQEELQDLQAIERGFPIVVSVLGIALLLVNVLAGFWQWHFWLTLCCGALLHVLFRVGKRAFKNTLNTMIEEASISTSSVEQLESTNAANAPRSTGKELIKQLGSVQTFMFLYAVMLVVCAFWYGLGSFIAWL